MVSFAAQEQPIQPDNTAFWARPAREPKPDESKGILLKGLGNTLEQGTKFANQFMEEGVVAPKTAEAATNERDSFIDALNSAREQSNQLDLMDPGSTSSQTDAKQGPAPAPVENLNGRVDTLQRALESGHLSETDYYGRLDALSKQLRAQYPGYRETIDRTISEVTGVHPANQYIRSAIADLNRTIGKRDQAQGRFDSMMDSAARESLFSPDEIAHYNQLHREHPDQFGLDQLQQEIARRSFNKTQMENDKYQAWKSEQSAKQAATWASGQVGMSVNSIVSNAMHNEKIAQGVLAGQSMESFLVDYANNKATISDEDAEALGRQEQVRRNLMYAQVMKDVNTPFTSGPYKGESLASLIGKGGEKTVTQTVDDAFKSWDAQIASIVGKDAIMADAHKKAIAASQNDFEYKARKGDPWIASTNDMLDMLRKHMGEQYFNNWFTSSPIFKQQIEPKYQALFNQDFLAATTQPRPGQSYEFIHDVQDFQNAQTNPGDAKNFIPLLMKGSDLITNKDTDQDTRRALTQYFFGAHAGELTSVSTKGNTEAFQYLYTDKMAQSIAKYNPDLYEQFKLGAEQNSRTLFREPIQTLKGLPNFKMDWVHDHFETNEQLRGAPKSGIDAMHKVNAMLQGLKAVYDHDKSGNPDNNTETFMLGQLADMGFNIEDKGVPSTIIKQLLATRGGSSDTEKPADKPKQKGVGVDLPM